VRTEPLMRMACRASRMPAGLLALLVALVLTSTASAASYTVTDLGTLGGETSEATAINNAGEVTGRAETNLKWEGRRVNQAFRYHNGLLTDLGVTEPEGFDGGPYSSPTGGQAINEAGDVAGWGGDIGGDVHALLFKADGSHEGLACGGAGCEESMAYGINNADEVVGGGQNFTLAWINNNQNVTLLGELPHGPCFGGLRPGQAFAINNLGQVVGEHWWPESGCLSHAFLYSGGTVHDLGTLGGRDSRATALNEGGTIVGTSEVTGGAEHAFSYHEGTMTDLGTLPEDKESRAFAVNESDEIVGVSVSGEITPELSGHAFIYRDGTMADLNNLLPPNSGWVLATAKGINNSGEIVGTGLHNGVERAFLLTPVPTATVSLASTTIDVTRRGQAAIMLTCSGGAPSCVGTLTLSAQSTVGRGRNKHTVTVTIGTVSGSIASGQTATVELRLNATGRALLSATHGTLAASLKIVKSSPEPTQEQTAAVSLAR